MWTPIGARKGENDHCSMKASRCLSTPLEPPLRPSYWLFRVATTSLHITCINISGCAIWLEKYFQEFKVFLFLFKKNYSHIFNCPNLISCFHSFKLVHLTIFYSLQLEKEAITNSYIFFLEMFCMVEFVLSFSLRRC